MNNKGIPSGNLYAGVGYVILPKGQDIETYKENCYRTNTITIDGGVGHPLFQDLFIDLDSIQRIEFPKAEREYGSPVVWINIPKHNRPVVIAVLKPDGQIIPLDEGTHKVTKVYGDNMVDFSMDSKNGILNIGISTTDETPAVVNIKLTDDKENSLYNLYSKGIVKFHGTKLVDIVSDKEINMRVINEKGEAKGLLKYKIGVGLEYSDEFGNKILAKKDVIEFNDGSNGGLVKVKELVEKINSLENQLNTILSTLKATTIPLAPTGTYPFLPLYSNIQPILPITLEADIKNDKVKH